jgi:hypothetical protein
MSYLQARSFLIDADAPHRCCGPSGCASIGVFWCSSRLSVVSSCRKSSTRIHVPRNRWLWGLCFFKRREDITKTIRAGIVGISGFGGGDVLRLIANHPSFELVYAAGEGSAGS